MKKSNSAAGIGLMTAIASSLCCIAPLLAILAGTSSLASNFSWIEPLQPYLIGLSVLAIGFAWYQQLKPVAQDDCGCEVPKTSFFQGKPSLGIVTVFAALMMAFPLYSKALFPKQQAADISTFNSDQLYTVSFDVTGMTCDGCEGHIEHAITGISGIVDVKASYMDAHAIVQFDGSQTSVEEITEAIKTTNYVVEGHKIIR